MSYGTRIRTISSVTRKRNGTLILNLGTLGDLYPKLGLFLISQYCSMKFIIISNLQQNIKVRPSFVVPLFIGALHC